MVIRMYKKTVVIFILCLAIFFALPYLSRGRALLASGEITSWGLSFSEKGAVPRGNASSEELAAYDAYYVMDTRDKLIVLTFDAGYENGYTEKILDTLKEKQVSATFFLVGNYITSEPELVKRMVNDGHTVANHTYSHPDMSKISDRESFSSQLTQLSEEYKRLIGSDMKKLYRPPQGKFSLENLSYAHELGYTTVFWSLAYVDWYENDQPSREQAFSKLVERIHPGAVVLLHSTSATNAEILGELIDKWRELGYRLCSIDELKAASQALKL